MFEREEGKLQEARIRLDDEKLPEDLIDQAIRRGVKKARQSKKTVYVWRTAAAAVLIILTVFVSSLRVSEAFASYVSTLPGMEKIVELVRQDKGLVSLIENDFAQSVDQSDSHQGIEVTLVSLISDEEQLVLFYSVDSETTPLEKLQIDQLRVETKSGKTVPFDRLSLPGLGNGGPDIYQSDFGLRKPLAEKEYVLVMSLKEDDHSLTDEWRIPFTIDHKKIGKTKEVNIAQSFTVEGQNIVVDSLEISPTRIGVNLRFPQENSKRIFEIEDLRLVDENGEAWSRISNGLFASGDFEEKTYYLQSNYFEKPEELYLAFNTIRALDKDELTVIVDPEKEKIIESPEGKLAKVFYEKGYDNNNALLFSWDKNYEQTNHMNPFRSFIDTKGIEHEISSSYGEGGYDGHLPRFGFPYDLQEVSGPITLELQDYPAWIKGEVKIRVRQ
ncbi:DUF4179 domain-containing protein [Bacillus sp. AK031]